MFLWLDHTLRTRVRLLSALLGIAAAVAAFLALFESTLSAEKRNLQWTAQLFRGNAQNALETTDVVQAFARTLEIDHCAPEALAALRQYVYSYYILSDVLVFDDDGRTVICTAQIGRLSVPHKMAPGQVDGIDPERYIWNGPEFPFYERDHFHHVARKGRFAVVLDTEILFDIFSDHSWQMYLRTVEDGFHHHAFGNKRLYQEYLEASRAWLVPANVVARSCITEDHPVCVLVSLSLPDVINRNALNLGIGLILAVLLGLFIYALTKRKILNRYTPAGRILRSLNRTGNNNFQCHYQPLVDLASGRVTGCEVLARYSDPLGPLPPATFIPLMEKQHHTWAFTELIMRRVVDDFRAAPNLPETFRVNINIFPSDLTEENFERVRGSAALRELLALGPTIVFELLETGVTDSGSHARTLTYLSENGVKIAIDDFGTGFSNLEQLKQADAHYLKIDKSFVDELSADEDSVVGTFIRHIVALASEIHIELVAEGIEIADQVPLLRRLNVKYGQGFLFSRPVPMDQFKLLINKSFQTGRAQEHKPGGDALAGVERAV